MKKLILSLMMATALTACGQKTGAPKEGEKPIIKIGATLPLTGNLAVYGKALQKSLIRDSFERFNSGREGIGLNGIKFIYGCKPSSNAAIS